MKKKLVQLSRLTLPWLLACHVVMSRELEAAFDQKMYSNWLKERSYQRQVNLPGPAAVHWTIVDGERIDLAVVVNATGWAAFGLSENGGMRGADMIIFEAEGEELIDAHVLESLVPIPDVCQSWTLNNSTIEEGLIIFEATRLLDTQDSQDRALFDDSSLMVQANRIVAAWGDTPNFSYHGPNRARGSVRFFGDDQGDESSKFASVMDAEAQGSFHLLSGNFAIPTQETTYQTFCFLESDLIAMGMPADTELHAIGIEPILDNRTEPYVHHFIVQAGTDADSCQGFEIAFAWAPGELPLAFPSIAGSPLGQGGFRSFHMQVHYNNPDRVPNLVDNSGIRVYFTSKKREFDLGMLELGDPLINLSGQIVGDGLTSYDFSCKPDCSLSFLAEPITVIRESLHMHKSGRRMFNAQTRGSEIIRAANADFFDFEQQGALNIVQDSYQIFPGDGFQTRCYYDSLGEQFGLASQEEMCIAFLMYYPRQTLFNTVPLTCGAGVSFGPFTQCEADWVRTDLASTDALERDFGAIPAVCPRAPTLAPTLAASALTNISSENEQIPTDSTDAPATSPTPSPSLPISSVACGSSPPILASLLLVFIMACSL